MGFESIISGHIAIHSSHQRDEQVELLRQEISKLSTLNNDTWPFLPQDIFHISSPISKEANPVQISYRSIMISFAMSIKQVEDELREWIEKFEIFLKSIPNAYEAKVIVKLDPFTGGSFNDGYLNYFWEKNTDKNGESKWSFDGDPMELKDFWKIRSKEPSPISPELKSKIIACFEWLSKQLDKIVEIEDFITHNKGNYDRHFAQHSTFNFNLDYFGVRTSGAVARMEGDKQQFEFKTDYITAINKSSDSIEIELDLDSKSSRRIIITVKNSDNMR